ncbi:MAG: PEPxxWA-CTERM sorting domain-containing protein [Proteobacteria bacterium]|nr:PEPxxWA-CTERM sorting domain-containing protein [Pseudomonadota bacterium]
MDNFTFNAAATLNPPGDFAPPGVPEPASWALMIAGFGLAGATLRRRRMLAA